MTFPIEIAERLFEGILKGFEKWEVSLSPSFWQRMTILWDGTILPCLMHGITDFSSMTLGNAKDSSVKELWQSEKEELLRKTHRNGGSHKIPACVECSYRTMELEKL